MQKIVGVRKFKEKEIYYFYQNIEELKLGEKLVVNFDEFQTIVTVAKLGVQLEEENANKLPKIIRKATESDIKKYESLLKKAKDDLPEIKKKSLELGLLMKFVSAEYSLDNSKIIIVFSSEERVDFRQLLKELALMLKVRIELKQIGQRDEAKICNSVGICGQQCCCSRFLKDFEHVTVKMAKIQGLSLAPNKINGVCGRLMCCLGYESPLYEETLKKMPKVGSEINTPSGLATVVYNDILREKVSVKIKGEMDTFTVEEFTLEELEQGKKIETNLENVSEAQFIKVSEKIDEIMGNSVKTLNENNKAKTNTNVEKTQNNSKKPKKDANFAQNKQNNNTNAKNKENESKASLNQNKNYNKQNNNSSKQKQPNLPHNNTNNFNNTKPINNDNNKK